MVFVRPTALLCIPVALMCPYCSTHLSFVSYISHYFHCCEIKDGKRYSTFTGAKKYFLLCLLWNYEYL